MLWVSPVLFDCHIRMTNRNIRDKLEQDRPISANQEGAVRAMEKGRNVEGMEYLFETERRPECYFSHSSILRLNSSQSVTVRMLSSSVYGKSIAPMYHTGNRPACKEPFTSHSY